MKAVKGVLSLEDGSKWSGISFGANKAMAGEVVFNTGMVGYPESLTDPSYKGQILCLTYPLIGNYGVPPRKKNRFGLHEFFESCKIQASGLVVADYSMDYSHWNAEKSLGAWLKSEGIPAVTGIDTRALTKKLREKGTMLGKLEFGAQKTGFFDPNKENIVKEVSPKKLQVYGKRGKKILLLDCGAKNNILNNFLNRGLRVIRAPWNFNPFKKKIDFDALFISNGPGDPKQCIQTIETVREALKREIPTLGICLGNQILALAAGADTYKLKYGHRSQNQPALLVGSQRCLITSQNHGFAVNEKTLPNGWLPWFRNLNDGSNEGIRHKSLPFRSVQFHPESTPGPNDANYLFEEFLGEMK
ncbi:MAG: glutamine-hydrolyzing carbamoyl-phosphate synthase small subunit [Candidatus Diapherotrites archaeon]